MDYKQQLKEYNMKNSENKSVYKIVFIIVVIITFMIAIADKVHFGVYNAH